MELGVQKKPKRKRKSVFLRASERATDMHVESKKKNMQKYILYVCMRVCMYLKIFRYLLHLV